VGVILLGFLTSTIQDELVVTDESTSLEVLFEKSTLKAPVPYVHRDAMIHTKFISKELDEDIKNLIYDVADYVKYDFFFDHVFLTGLLKEMMWIEDNYSKEFIDSLIKRNSGDPVNEGDYKNYHRVSKVYWLTFLKKEHLP
jgi:hypothetical protein